MPPHDNRPEVTCLCPTYGRFERLREALACFLAQDYPNKHLLILNDAPEPIRHSPPAPGDAVAESVPSVLYDLSLPVEIINAPPLETLGHKRQALLEAAQTPLVAHWDDDDLYLPHHLTRAVAALLARPGATCAKGRGAWFMVGTEVRGIRHNVFEGQMVFSRARALELGGYPPRHSGQAKALLGKFHKAGELVKIGDWADGPPSYVYRWDQGVGHISALGNRPESLAMFQARNTDFGDGGPLTPADLTPYWEALLARAREDLSSAPSVLYDLSPKDRYQALEALLNPEASAAPPNYLRGAKMVVHLEANDIGEEPTP